MTQHMTETFGADWSSTALWQQLVRDAADYNGIPLDEELESYLVFLLMRHLQHAHLAGKTMALEFLNGLQAPGRQRLDQMRDVGDQCLLFSGLFPGRAQRRQVSVDYYIKLGRTAYLHLADMTQHALAAMYNHLADSFIALMDTLQAMRCLGRQDPDFARLEPLLAYEHWHNKTQRHASRQFADGIPVRHEQIGADPDRRH